MYKQLLMLAVSHSIQQVNSNALQCKCGKRGFVHFCGNYMRSRPKRQSGGGETGSSLNEIPRNMHDSEGEIATL